MISSSSNGWCAPTLSDADMYCTKEKLSISIIISWRKWFFSFEKKKKKKKKWANITRAGHLNISINIYYVFSGIVFREKNIRHNLFNVLFTWKKKERSYYQKKLWRDTRRWTHLWITVGPILVPNIQRRKYSLDIEIAVCVFFSFSLRRVKTRLECDELFDVRHDFAFYFSKGR